MSRHPPLSAGPACTPGAAQEEHLLLLRNATAARLLLEHTYVLGCIVLFSTPLAADFGPGLDRALEGAQLDGESLLSTPLAGGSGPGPEEAGRTAGRRYFLPLLSPPSSGLVWWRGGGACSWTRN